MTGRMTNASRDIVRNAVLALQDDHGVVDGAALYEQAEKDAQLWKAGNFLGKDAAARAWNIQHANSLIKVVLKFEHNFQQKTYRIPQFVHTEGRERGFTNVDRLQQDQNGKPEKFLDSEFKRSMESLVRNRAMAERMNLSERFNEFLNTLEDLRFPAVHAPRVRAPRVRAHAPRPRLQVKRKGARAGASR